MTKLRSSGDSMSPSCPPPPPTTTRTTTATTTDEDSPSSSSGGGNVGLLPNTCRQCSSLHCRTSPTTTGSTTPSSSSSSFVSSFLRPQSVISASGTIHKRKDRWKCWSVASLVHYRLVNLMAMALLLSCPIPAVRCSQNAFDIWENEITLDATPSYRNFVVQWTPSEDKIVFRITARTRGYIGFGFHDKPQMDGADIVVGWVHSGKLYLQDRYGKGNEAPHVDRQQDWDLIGGFENDTHTVLQMSRPFITCDSNDHPITNDTVRLLWAYHPDDPVDPESPRPRLHYHGGARRGSTTLFLLQRAKESMPRRPIPINYPRAHFHTHTYQPPDPPLHSWSLVGPPASIVSDFDSIHWCRLFKRPHLSRKHHVVRYEPVLSVTGAPYVQHMMMYECIRLSAEDERMFGQLVETAGGDCNVGTMQRILSACNEVVVAWALGSEGVWLPPEAGYPLTPEGPLFYLLETHYDVPMDNSTGSPIRDSSGVRLLHTPVLRNYDAGILSVGLHPNWKHIIPPRQQSVLSEGHCVGECTHAAFPSSGINVFGVIFHTHMLGRQVRLRHLRGDVEFEPIASDFNYDFKYQEYRALRNFRKVLPGDHLIGECTYNSEECSSLTLGGFKTRDEMCLSFLFYYPKIDLSVCHSKPSLGTVLQSLGIQELSENSNPITIRLPEELAGKTLKWRLQNYDWENHSEHFQEATHAGNFNTKCRAHDTDYLSVPQERSYPNVTKPWKAHHDCERQRRKNKLHKKTGKRDRTPSLDIDGRSEEDGMVDDETSHKLIERIDVDPIFNINDEAKNRFVESANFGGVFPAPAVDSRQKALHEETLQSELDEMERELEKELHHKPHLPSEQFDHRPTTASSTCLTRPWTNLVASLLLLLIRR